MIIILLTISLFCCSLFNTNNKIICIIYICIERERERERKTTERFGREIFMKFTVNMIFVHTRSVFVATAFVAGSRSGIRLFRRLTSAVHNIIFTRRFSPSVAPVRVALARLASTYRGFTNVLNRTAERSPRERTTRQRGNKSLRSRRACSTRCRVSNKRSVPPPRRTPLYCGRQCRVYAPN